MFRMGMKEKKDRNMEVEAGGGSRRVWMGVDGRGRKKSVLTRVPSIYTQRKFKVEASWNRPASI